jgi:tetratricopeptide (TPR) repeat protein
VQSLAEYYAAEKHYAEAAAILQAAQNEFPGDLDVRFQLAAMLERQKKYNEAERIFREVIAKDPRHAPSLNYLGYTLVERGERFDEALDLIKRAVEVDPYNGAYLDSLGWAYFKLNRIDLAERNLKTAAGQLPRDSVVQDHWGDLLARQGRYGEAIEAWRRALAGDGESIDRAQIERKIRDAQDKTAKK